ncbi:phosphorylase [Raphidocelis subcapitata]|uniref:Phosphorylase n=1 Tax=Raphidocelis subcapitata TaxID=307507 RepID=A0A2V0PLF1_9CHLO|nr:phosphorylase [Raphidocelis subcapitata]|eukprot:GBG00602.1 phosphorylase [Raphidocelis subcapitata]
MVPGSLRRAAGHTPLRSLIARRAALRSRAWGRVAAQQQQHTAQAHGMASPQPAWQPLPPEQLWQSIESVYERAQQTGAAFKTETRTELLRDPTPPGIEFVLRVAAALKAKPKGPPPQQQGQQPAAAKAAWVNPFLPYEEALWVAHLSPTHTLLLNKFNVVAKHVLVVTRGFESQTDPLNANDLEATVQVLRAFPAGAVAFYNCGEHSGRSQPHKHLQIVPLPFDDRQPPEPAIQAVVDAACRGAAPLEVVELRALPFRAYAARLDGGSTSQQLEALASRLLAACQHGLAAPVSYNALLWRGAMVMVPRSQECAGPCAINSLGFAGTMLLRSEEDLAYTTVTGPLKMLATVGVPW